MRELKFTHFLEEYVKSMSVGNTLSLFKLEKEVEENERLLTLVSLLLLFSDQKAQTLKKHKKALKKLYKKYLETSKKYKGNFNELGEVFLKELDEFDDLYKTFHSYQNKLVNRDVRLKEIYFSKIMDLKENKKVSNYKIYKSLNLNVGNTNDFLKNKKLEKMSIKNTKSIYNYLLNI